MSSRRSSGSEGERPSASSRGACGEAVTSRYSESSPASSPYLGLTVFLPSIVVVLLSGIWLVLDFSGDFTKLWLVLGIGAFVAAFLIGAVFLSRSAIRFDRLAKSGDLEGARSALGSWMVGYAVVLAILVFAVWDMVFKPGTGG